MSQGRQPNQRLCRSQQPRPAARPWTSSPASGREGRRGHLGELQGQTVLGRLCGERSWIRVVARQATESDSRRRAGSRDRVTADLTPDTALAADLDGQPVDPGPAQGLTTSAPCHLPRARVPSSSGARIECPREAPDATGAAARPSPPHHRRRPPHARGSGYRRRGASSASRSRATRAAAEAAGGCGAGSTRSSPGGSVGPPPAGSSCSRPTRQPPRRANRRPASGAP